MKFTDVKELSTVEVNKKIRETKEKMFEARMKNSMGQMTNPVSIRGMRRDIARLKTVLTAKLRGAP
ncbi:MAG: 50S ribosomal protein L29 [Bdellovibrionaceae bacterium]|jgi:large subunit ribosomal protein L29|nr:50S ribosomal protein L29 [Pseudobdellovibrionaceae bacterium]